jgi:mannose-6-phosphate isomerase-like protein (cupin superfamily)
MALASGAGEKRVLVLRGSDAEGGRFLAGDRSLLVELLHPERRNLPGVGFSLAHARVPRGEVTDSHRLRTSLEVYYLLKGRGILEVDGERAELLPGDAALIPPGGRQRIESLGEEDLEFLCIVSPPWSAEDEAVGGDEDSRGV